MKHYKKLRFALCLIIALNPLLVTYTHSMSIPVPVIAEAAKAAAVGLTSAACVEVGRRVTNFVRRHLYRDYDQSPAEAPQVQQPQQIPQSSQAQQSPSMNLDSLFKFPFQHQDAKPSFDCSLQGILRAAGESAIPITPQLNLI